MNKFNHIKILPIMIAVAFLAFSVRLADVASNGVPDFSGSAYAKEEPKAEEPAQLAAAETQEEEHATPHEEEKTNHESTPPTQTKKVGSKWRDASDSYLDYDSVKVEMYKDLADRRKTLEKREKELLTKEAMLTAAERELDRKYKEMEQLRGKIEDLLSKQSEEEKKRIQSLVKIYENMKPANAASIFNTLDIDVLVSVMAEMSERRLSPILAAMNPERARTVTIILAEQMKLPDFPQ